MISIFPRYSSTGRSGDSMIHFPLVFLLRKCNHHFTDANSYVVDNEFAYIARVTYFTMRPARRSLRHIPRSRAFIESLRDLIISSTHGNLVNSILQMSFNSIPILDLALARDENSKQTFLNSLRDALLDVGFFYIKNTGIDDSLIDSVIEQGKAFFELPEENKIEVQMKNKASFLGKHLSGDTLAHHEYG